MRVSLGPLVLVALLAATVPARAYTIKQTDSGATVRWHRAALTLEIVRVDPGTLSRPGLTRALSSAASRWSEVPGVPALSVREGEAREDWGYDGVNGVYVLRRWPFPDERLAVTVSTYSPATGELVDTDVLVNGEMRLGEAGRDHGADAPYDLEQLLAHELGHVLGLDESAEPVATMFPTHRPGESARRELSADDVDGAMALYGGAAAPATPGVPTVAAYGCQIGVAEGASPGAVASAILLLALLARRFR